MNKNNDCRDIKLIIIDVDGTMTDGGIYYDEHGNEYKKFNTKDASAFFMAHSAGLKIMVLTGRKCAATQRRMQELKVEYINQNVIDKAGFIKEFMTQNELEKKNLAYIGDDLNDYKPMKMCGFVGCPADACEQVKDIADYVSNVNGGYGAVRDVVFHILEKREELTKTINKVYLGDGYDEYFNIGI